MKKKSALRLRKKYKVILYVTLTLILGWILTVSGISAFKYLKLVDAFDFVVDGQVLYTLPIDSKEDVEMIIKKYKLSYLSVSKKGLYSTILARFIP